MKQVKYLVKKTFLLKDRSFSNFGRVSSSLNNFIKEVEKKLSYLNYDQLLEKINQEIVFTEDKFTYSKKKFYVYIFLKFFTSIFWIFILFYVCIIGITVRISVFNFILISIFILSFIFLFRNFIKIVEKNKKRFKFQCKIFVK